MTKWSCDAKNKTLAQGTLSGRAPHAGYIWVDLFFHEAPAISVKPPGRIVTEERLSHKGRGPKFRALDRKL
jgi:hypothetical protein